MIHETMLAGSGGEMVWFQLSARLIAIDTLGLLHPSCLAISVTVVPAS